MKIAIVGYGKMGKTIDRIARECGHEISQIIDPKEGSGIQNLQLGLSDVAIEFTQPESAYQNIHYCVSNRIPIVSGTTGWLDKKAEIEALSQEKQSAFFYASNFSIGVNLFFKLNKTLAQMMQAHSNYQVSMEEIHHTEKKDAPSGTAITLAEGLIDAYDSKNHWVNHEAEKPDELSIISKRIPQVPGTHSVLYKSAIDDIEIRHTAHSREGFARGAVLAAEWLIGKVGVFGMEDMLG